VATLKNSKEKMPKGDSMLYIVIYMVVSFVMTVLLWAALAIAKQTDNEKEKNLTGIIFKLASTRVTNRNQ
jgi:membrane protein implicated in regulation of membrane protease activity